MKELLDEIWNSVRRNKLRTFLTGFSVAWGIFMLIILLGSGNGLRNGVQSNFEGQNVNTVSVGGGTTSKAYGGYQSGRRVRLKRDDIDYISKEIENVDEISSEVSRTARINYEKVHTISEYTGVTSEYQRLESLKMIEGRFFNEGDIKEARRLVVLDDVGAKTLFNKRSPIGKLVTIENVVFKVIGVSKRQYGGSQPISFIPISTYFQLYATTDNIGWLTLSLKNVSNLQQSQEFEENFRKGMSARHNFDATDRRALRLWNNIENYLQMQMVFTGLNIFIWIIGLGTLLAGIVGVSNIMLVTVRERTAEFGIRKSMGASPASLVRLILIESVIITAIFGYIGMLAGIGVMEIVNIFIERQLEVSTSEMPVIFKNPTLDLSVVVSATIVLVISGMIAGYVPARRAARIKTIDAMRHNK